MKKLLFVCLMLLAFSTSKAEVINYEANALAIRIHPYSWGDWIETYVTIAVDYTNSRVVINSQLLQVYRILRVIKQTNNEVVLRIIDQDQDIGDLRILRQSRTAQLYVEFDNISWVYSIPYN